MEQITIKEEECFWRVLKCDLHLMLCGVGAFYHSVPSAGDFLSHLAHLFIHICATRGIFVAGSLNVR